MVYRLMHGIAGSAALLWSSLAFSFLFFKYYFFCNNTVVVLVFLPLMRHPRYSFLLLLFLIL
ncbi:hypothetical protein FB192DRAFT_1359180, partial [Mucor lusitanicus]